MAKRYVDINVYTAAQQRLEYIFNEFDNVLVAFSGGKDSGVCLNLCYDYAKKHNMLDKLAMYHLDYEAQYQMTTDYVTETFEQFNDIKRYWLCLPVGADCGCSAKAGRIKTAHAKDRVSLACAFFISAGGKEEAVQAEFIAD